MGNLQISVFHQDSFIWFYQVSHLTVKTKLGNVLIRKCLMYFVITIIPKFLNLKPISVLPENMAVSTLNLYFDCWIFRPNFWDPAKVSLGKGTYYKCGHCHMETPYSNSEFTNSKRAADQYFITDILTPTSQQKEINTHQYNKRYS